MEPMGYIAAMRQFFGLNGKTLPEFAAELRATKDDRDFFIAGLEQNGYVIKREA